MTAEEAWIVNERIKAWPAEERAWWKKMLYEKPTEATVIADLVLHLNIRPFPGGANEQG